MHYYKVIKATTDLTLFFFFSIYSYKQPTKRIEFRYVNITLTTENEG